MAKKKDESLIIGSVYKDVWSKFSVEKEESEVYDRCHTYILRCMGVWGMCCPKEVCMLRRLHIGTYQNLNKIIFRWA